MFPVCTKDAHLLAAGLEWCFELDGGNRHPAVLAYDASLHPRMVEHLSALISKAFPKFSLFQHPTPPIRTWPQAPNWVFQNVAQRMKETADPWLWMEPDAWALKPGWLDAIESEYFQSGKAVMGPVVKGMGHCNGVAVYPANFCDLSPRAMRATSAAWDSSFILDVQGNLADASNLMQHAWGNNPGKGFTQFGGVGSPTFKSPADLRWIQPSAVLFHRCKDLTLVEQLRRVRPKPAPAKASPKVEIFIVSFSRDIEWLKFNLRSIAKFAKGFSGVTVAVPQAEVGLFQGLSTLCPLRVVGFAPDPDPSKHFIQHQEIKLRADEFCPNADFIFHTDSDCIFCAPVTPDDYFHDGKPELLIESFHRVGGAAQWKAGIDHALKINSERETMRRHPAIHPRGVYLALRSRIETLHGMPFTRYILSSQNVSEFNWIGNFALITPAWKEKYHWIDRDHEPDPQSSKKLMQFWSRGSPTTPQSCPHEPATVWTPTEIINRILA